MDNNATIFINFPAPGQWDRFVITALWTDADGFACRRTYKSGDLTDEQLDVIRSGIGTVVDMDAPWRATHAAVILNHIEPDLAQPGEGGATYDVLDVQVYARRADGATRSFDHNDIPALRVQGDAAVAAFKLFIED